MAAAQGDGSLGPTASVILGMLSFGPKSGYEIKGFVDRSTRFFWAASYGQIYPELRRLEGAGLVAGESSPTGDRRRTVYRITTEGEAAHDAWLTSPGAGYELRDLGLLKLFFADSLDAAALADLVERLRAERAATLERLQAIKAATDRPKRLGAELVIEYGIATHTMWVDWLSRVGADIEQSITTSRSDGGAR